MKKERKIYDQELLYADDKLNDQDLLMNDE
jgi:hypothetical protein